MSEPKIEYKTRQNPTTISLIEEKIRRREAQARVQVHRLEKALTRCGYTRDCHYRDGRGSPGRPATVLFWAKGKIQMAQGKDRDMLDVDKMSVRQLLRLADHLPRLVDEMERSSRWLLQSLEAALTKLDSFIQDIEADPQPSNEEP